MTGQGNSRGLELPPQEKAGKESFDLRPRKVSAWVKALPLGNIGETTKLLYQALLDANRHKHGWQRRYHFLESIREPLHLVQQAISRRYTGQGFPLPAKIQQIATLSQNLNLEMAIGYKRAIEDMLSALFLFQSRHALKIMVHRTCRYLSLNLLTSYQIYSQQQSGAWHELHRLYRFAEQQDFHQEPINDRFFSELPESSIARVYKQIVLLATVSPFSLRQGEAIAIYQALSRWSAHAKLITAHDEDATTALFVIHLESDHEPDYHAFDHQPCDDNSCLLVDTRQLRHIVDDECSYITDKPGSVMTAELYSRLLHTWGVAPKRGEHRSESGQHINIIVGMTHIHQLMAPSMHDEAIEAHPSHFESHAVPAVQPRPQASGDVWNIYSAKSATPAGKHVSQVAKEESAAADADILRWNVRNESPGGFRLAIPDNQSAGVRVGELLALREEFSRSRWTLGVVRWIRQFPHTGIEAGVQLLAPHMVPIMIKNLSPGKDKGEAQRGLLLPTMEEGGQNPTLITPNKIFMTSDRVMLHILHNEVEALLENAIQDGATFVQFEFASERPQADSAHDSIVHHTGDSSFAKLWEQL